MYRETIEFLKNKRVFLTGHTGFKGSWLSQILLQLGVTVTGYSLEPPTTPSLFELLEIETEFESIIGDIRNRNMLLHALSSAKPDIVVHMAAQPLVLDSYLDPIYTYETNVMGTINLLDSIRSLDTVQSFINVTTDKVYLNDGRINGYVETDHLDGNDPYSNSKSCSELVTAAYRRSFFNSPSSPSLSTLRAGNVIGGGDFSNNRIIPDCVQAARSGEVIKVRNPLSVRPYQHVLEPLLAYLLLAYMQTKDKSIQGSYNIGPDDSCCVTTMELVEIFCSAWGEGLQWEHHILPGSPHEAPQLRLDNSKIKQQLGWKPQWNIRQAVEATVEFSKALDDRSELKRTVQSQISKYISLLLPTKV